MRAVFDVSRLLSYASDSPASLPAQAPLLLQRTSMRGSFLCTKYCATYYSALGYRCPMSKDDFGYSAKECNYGDDDTEEKTGYWRWVAFRRFCLRSKRFASASKLCDIGCLECNHKAAKTCAKTMRNPQQNWFTTEALKTTATLWRLS